ncbi:MAG: nucleotidyltransferase domain-containing protein [Ignavibacteriaceae bacterium]|jgi:predicted nucleotidyltransferase|nr:nucleotidyltransferase domain-containing protein [Ignavibacteriaceae bacterium]
MDILELLNKVKTALKKLYKKNLIDIVLYGSYAKQEYNKDSDIDLLIILDKIESVGKEIDKIVDATYDISLEYNTLISAIPITYEDYKNVKSPLLINVRKEGIIIE